MIPIRTAVNGSPVVTEAVNPSMSLLDLLRESLNLKGTKQGCGSGDCGACTVIVEGSAEDSKPRAINACITPAGFAHNKHVITVEGLADGDQLHPVQQALIDEHGSQCGFCTPGFVMALVAHGLGAGAPKKCSRQDIVGAISGNLCRCTGYWPIINAGLKSYDSSAARWLSHLPRQQAPVDAADEDTGIGHVAYRTLQSEEELSQLLGGFDPAPDMAPEKHSPPMLVAGTTDTWVAVNQDLVEFDRILDISQIHSLRQIVLQDKTLSIGACVTHSELYAFFQQPAQRSTAMLELMQRFGSPQIRNRGTIGGNICGGSPIADWSPVLLALDASVTIKCADGHRQVSLDDFFLGYRQTCVRPHEYLASIEFDVPQDWSMLSFSKISKRYEDDISSVCAAIFIERNGTLISNMRLAYGGVAATPLRLPDIEAALIGTQVDAVDRLDLRERLAAAVHPISDVRASADYRLQMAITLLLDRLSTLAVGE